MSSLTITRRPGEAVRIGSDVKVTISTVRGNQVRIRVEAPREVLILREELEDGSEQEGREGLGKVR